jgi:hypothetical protein
VLLTVPPVITTLLEVMFVIVLLVALATVKTALPPVMLTDASASEPFPIPLMAFVTVVKFASRFASGIDVVAAANVLGIVIGSAILEPRS